jgi:hypothetical protein
MPSSSRCIKSTLLALSILLSNTLPAEYIFERNNSIYFQTTQNFEMTKEVFEQIKKKQFWAIDFVPDSLVFDNRGTCSAMALDFLARYITCVKNEPNLENRLEILRGFNPYYHFNTNTFTSRQAAFNTVTIELEARENLELLDPDVIKELKMHSLANYHDIELRAATPTINRNVVAATPGSLKSIIDDLPNGEYIIRSISPNNNHKLESFGHTTILIKHPELSLFYDNAKGLRRIDYQELSDYIEEELTVYRSIPEIMIFRAFCESDTCANLSEETS